MTKRVRRKLPKRESIIDMHGHPRDMEQAHKMTVSQYLIEAVLSGISIFGYMPNTDPPITTIEALNRYLEICHKEHAKYPGTRFFVWFGATDDNLEQAKWALEYPEVIGTKFYPKSPLGHNVTTGNRIGVSQIGSKLTHMALARNAGKPTAHHCDCSLVIDVEGNSICAEVTDVATTIQLGYEIKGSKILICHVSNFRSASLVHQAKQNELDIAMELMPQYLRFDSEGHNWNDRLDPVFYHCYNNLRSFAQMEALRGLLKSDSRIVIVSSDSASHTKREKLEQKLGGIPSHQHMIPVICTLAEKLNLSDERVAQLLSWNAADFFGFEIDRELEQVELEWREDDLPYNEEVVVSPWKGSRLLFPIWG